MDPVLPHLTPLSTIEYMVAEAANLMVKTLLLFFHISLQMPIPFDHTTNIQKDPKVT